MMSSRPEIAIALSLALMPDLGTELLIASMTVGASLMEPSAIASGGSEAVPSAVNREEPPASRSWRAFTELDPMSSAKMSAALRKNAILNAFPLVTKQYRRRAPGGQ